MGVEPRIWERSYPRHSCIKDKPEVMKKLPPHFSVNCFPHGGLSRAVMSGPDGLADQRAHVLLDKRPVHHYHFTNEGSYDTDYLWRRTPLPGTPVHLRPRSAFAGEIGWHASVCRDPDPPRTGHQILMSEFWQQSNDRGSHRYQDVWYPGPGQAGKPEQSYYFERFPTTGQRLRRARTAVGLRSANDNMTSSGPIASQPPQRVPSATRTSGGVNIVSVEQSEDGRGSNTDTGADSSALTHHSSGGNQTKNGTLLKSRQSSPIQRRMPEDTSSSSHTTYQRLPSPPSSQTHQP
ncbi:uncharacterized protein LOC143292050 [Babylonia areolata]|uniref:uncharacterized protein LOC143292050 n=1 Tax=Babylonia areolata TaxID=304850 RepID=UPI003FD683F4